MLECQLEQMQAALDDEAQENQVHEKIATFLEVVMKQSITNNKQMLEGPQLELQWICDSLCRFESQRLDSGRQLPPC